MKEIKTYYINNNSNMGDRLNVLIFEKIFGITPVKRTSISCEISGIGSMLGRFCYADEIQIRLAEHVTRHLFTKPAYIWGTGFMNYRNEDRPLFRKDIQFCAVRGELSRHRIEKLTGREMDIPVCDGGILAAELVKEDIQKKYRLGIIPHFTEMEEHDYRKLQERIPDSTIIRVTDDPMEVIRTIASCEYVVSGSLHGMIVADSFHVPNLHVKVTDHMLGDGFKFDDYLSGYGLRHRVYQIEDIESVDLIAEQYSIKESIVEQKKVEMRKAFPLDKFADKECVRNAEKLKKAHVFFI